MGSGTGTEGTDLFHTFSPFSFTSKRRKIIIINPLSGFLPASAMQFLHTLHNFPVHYTILHSALCFVSPHPPHTCLPQFHLQQCLPFILYCRRTHTGDTGDDLFGTITGLHLAVGDYIYFAYLCCPVPYCLLCHYTHILLCAIYCAVHFLTHTPLTTVHFIYYLCAFLPHRTTWVTFYHC